MNYVLKFNIKNKSFFNKSMRILIYFEEYQDVSIPLKYYFKTYVFC